ncbi:hypothetical protein BO70DRAFT_134758 [Aspergillus heteromorphus CBS 117.55]|uniref:Uncharacterized protein n=1 Tax=Aspergillus heteromorphus CBS 117.55 TaxID=1448321 RepID=A0A317WUV3_9EURO|nr:uncharacterized protein BO70DRAFT_134758 [Aspergillus heteromorphus CBS 117.55]PWY90129.1 hypothetical protein BO70DRAFT_134758 [Aspergillus heteromorphus CBS 117.55]
MMDGWRKKGGGSVLLAWFCFFAFFLSFFLAFVLHILIPHTPLPEHRAPLYILTNIHTYHIHIHIT